MQKCKVQVHMRSASRQSVQPGHEDFSRCSSSSSSTVWGIEVDVHTYSAAYM